MQNEVQQAPVPHHEIRASRWPGNEPLGHTHTPVYMTSTMWSGGRDTMCPVCHQHPCCHCTFHPCHLHHHCCWPCKFRICAQYITVHPLWSMTYRKSC